MNKARQERNIFNRIFKNFSMPRLTAGNKYTAARRTDNISIGKQLAVTPGGRHAWYQSGSTRVRKPL